jgi:hypothetical protein
MPNSPPAPHSQSIQAHTFRLPAALFLLALERAVVAAAVLLSLERAPLSSSTLLP